MNSISKIVKQAIKERNREDELNKKLGLYLTPHAIMGYHGITDFVVIGSRGRGKSVFSLDAAIAAKRKYGYENVKIYYFRISDTSVKAMLANKGSKAIDPILMHKYDLQITTKNNILYDAGKPLIEFYPLVSAAKVGKGVNLYDADFLNKRPLDPRTGKPIKRFIFVIWDEFLMAEGVEKKTVGNPVDQFLIYREAIFRDQEVLDYDAVRIFYLANAVSECAPVTGRLFNFIPRPGDFGIKKLTRHRCVVWNVPNSEAYLEKRKKSYNANVIDYDEDPNYTNVVLRDLNDILPKSFRLNKVTSVIMFTKFTKDWFCIYDGRYIRQYRNETVNKNAFIPMKRHLDKLYNQEIVKTIFDMYDAKAFKYADIMSQANFSALMKELKAK